MAILYPTSKIIGIAGLFCYHCVLAVFSSLLPSGSLLGSIENGSFCVVPRVYLFDSVNTQIPKTTVLRSSLSHEKSFKAFAKSVGSSDAVSVKGEKGALL